MSYKEIDGNLPWLYDTIDEIMDKHKDDRGIIHSVSFNLTEKIYNNVSKENQKRLIIYSGTDEKKIGLDLLKLQDRKVIIGPSLTTGISLDDNFARFLIFSKVPYQSLADRFVKAKMQLNYSGYLWKTIIEIQQGLGRPIRSKDDWCISYLLDGCFSDLLFKHRNFFPQELLQRIQVIK
jgi:Rad3-related DNA helicase